MSRKGIETEAKILKLLALNKGTSQYDIPDKIGVHYTTVLRQLKKLENEKKVTFKEIGSMKKGKDKKIYSLTLEGLLEVFYNWNNKTIAGNDVLKIIEDYKNIGWLCFKKFHLFKEAGLQNEMVQYIVDGFFYMFRRWMRLQEYIKAGFEKLDPKIDIDRGILFDYLFIKQNMEIAKVCKSDLEINDFINAEFERRRKEFEAFKKVEQFWKDL